MEGSFPARESRPALGGPAPRRWRARRLAVASPPRPRAPGRVGVTVRSTAQQLGLGLGVGLGLGLGLALLELHGATAHALQLTTGVITR
eukprot:scaffold88863_cov40-Phaeocystis_antarctica.AAC.1